MTAQQRIEAIQDTAWMVADQFSDPRIYDATVAMLRAGYVDHAAHYVGRKYKQLVKG